MGILEAFLWIAAPFGIFQWIGQKKYCLLFTRYCWQFTAAEAATWNSSDTWLGYGVANSCDKNPYMKLLLWSDLIAHSFFPTDSSFSTGLVFKQK